LKNNVYASIELGSFEIKILVCNIREERLFVLAQKSVPSVGIERGQITNFDKLVSQMKQLKASVEGDLGQSLKQVMLILPTIDAVVEPVISKINLDVKQPITSVEVRKLLRQVMNLPHEEMQLPINVVPRLFRIDENHVVQNPRGISGMSLSLEGSRIVMPTMVVSNLIHATESAGFEISEIVAGSVAEALSALNSPEMFARSCQINLGHLMTTMTVVNDGRIIYSHTLPIGGHNVTCSIVEELQIPYDVADKLKVDFGTYIIDGDDTGENQIIYIDDSADELRYITHRMLNTVITQQYDQLFKLIRTHVSDHFRLKEDEYHYSLSGGASGLPNVLYALYAQLPYMATIHKPTMLGARCGKYTPIIGSTIFAHEITLLIGSKKDSIELDFEKKPEVKRDTVVPFSTSTLQEKPEMVTTSQPVEEQVNPLSLKDEILSQTQQLRELANMHPSETEVVETDKVDVQPQKEMKLFDDLAFDPMVEVESSEYMDKKLENSGMFVKLFDMIFNESEE